MTTPKPAHEMLKRADEMREQAARIRDQNAKAELLKLSKMWERLARTVRPHPVGHKH